MENDPMGKLGNIGSRAYPEKRKHRRFVVRYPVQVRFHFGNSVSELQAVSDNVSLGGLLLQADSPLPQSHPVSFIVRVRGHHIVGPRELGGEGEVVRVEPHRSGTGFAIAIKCKRAISELEPDLASSA
jgi:PilZ domain